MIKFVGSFETVKSLPNSHFAEYAFIGRSNVGKSSLINAVVGTPIARTSNTPGRTQSLNLFNLDDRVMIVDLPGYGYAKVSKVDAMRWLNRLEEYLLNRKQIKSLIQFIDARHDIQKNDLQMREWIKAYNLPIFTIVTKIDYVIISHFDEDHVGGILAVLEELTVYENVDFFCGLYIKDKSDEEKIIYYDEEEPCSESPTDLKIVFLNFNAENENTKNLIKQAQEFGFTSVNEITDDVDYVVCDNLDICKEDEDKIDKWCIPIISSIGFRCRFRMNGEENKENEENSFFDMLNDDIYEELYECTYTGDYYEMFYQYGMGKVIRKTPQK